MEGSTILVVDKTMEITNPKCFTRKKNGKVPSIWLKAQVATWGLVNTRLTPRSPSLRGCGLRYTQPCSCFHGRQKRKERIIVTNPVVFALETNR